MYFFSPLSVLSCAGVDCRAVVLVLVIVLVAVAIVVMLLLLAHVVEGNATRVDATTVYTIDAHKRTRSQEIEFELKKS